MICKSQTKINTHPTRDAVSDVAANGPLRTALFKPGTRAQCKCSAGGCGPQDCDELWLFDAEGSRIACFYGSDFRAVEEQNSGGSGLGRLCVYRMPTATRDETRLLQLRDALVRLNRQNAEFWQQSGATARTGDEAHGAIAAINKQNEKFWRNKGEA